MMKILLKTLFYLLQDHMNLKMVQSILDNGKMELDMVKESSIGMMEVYMKDIGEIVRNY